MTESPEINKLGKGYYVLGGLSYIPAIGILFGIISIIIGLIKLKKGGKSLIYIGLGGILLSVVLYGSLFYFGFVKRGGVYDDLRIKMAKNNITSLVETIEFYKLQNGIYPVSLKSLAKSMPKDKPIFINDATKVGLVDNNVDSEYYFEVIEDGKAYYLLGVGPDGKPFTSDDILPEIDMSKSNKIGFRIKNNK